MKLVLRNYSQDVDILNPNAAKNFVVFREEETGKELRLPVPMETITHLAQFIEGLKSSRDVPKPIPGVGIPDLEEPAEGEVAFGGDGAAPEPEPEEEPATQEDEIPSL